MMQCAAALPRETFWDVLLSKIKLLFAAQSLWEPADSPSLSREEINRRAEKAFDSYANSILRYAYSYLKNTADAEEVLEDTLIRYLQAAPEFESPQHEKAWLLRVAANLCKNRLRFSAAHPSDELSQELVSEQREDLSFVWDAVRSLPERYREVIHLFYYEGFSTREIASILAKKEATVRSLLTRGRDALRSVLKEAYDFDETV